MRRSSTEHESVISASNRVERYSNRHAISRPKEDEISALLPLALGLMDSSRRYTIIYR